MYIYETKEDELTLQKYHLSFKAVILWTTTDVPEVSPTSLAFIVLYGITI
jgi:hypothetical protein